MRNLKIVTKLFTKYGQLIKNIYIFFLFFFINIPTVCIGEHKSNICETLNLSALADSSIGVGDRVQVTCDM